MPADASLMITAASALSGAMPVLVSLLAIGALAKAVAQSLPMPDMPRSVLKRVAGAAISIALTSIGAFVLLTLFVVNTTALRTQRDFETIMNGIDRDAPRRSFGG